ncbi:OLC1v1024557C1 [Oldenlandia corymbosa var. corymbosa]|uniref:OLC1v1024557C1 n=1 Tax=Oldenlandia corymbosa var. corymbosa TaxID=529605 RepID=A0AAV1C2W8_OLDCO|nr:OLC1v1024557C1 [Oldenlandia corymbosa var. corymbosa]
MVSYLRPSFLPAVTAALLLFSAFISSGEARGLATYWGQIGKEEGSLALACYLSGFDWAVISFLNNFGGGKTPKLNLADHCDAADGNCAFLSTQIKACQYLQVKVFLSVGGPDPNYSLDTQEDADFLVSYLWDNFLGGTAESRPLGDVVLDGIDFAIESGSNKYWKYVAEKVHALSTPAKKVYLTTAPKCRIPDYYMDGAIRLGIFDYVWVKFYNDSSCQYEEISNDFGVNSQKLLASWYTWHDYPGINKLVMGTPSYPEATPGGGYMYVDPYYYYILPILQKSAKFGGTMFWTVNYSPEKTVGGSVSGSKGLAIV